MRYKSDRLLFEQEILNRKITRLVHFTTANNLFSIFEQGCLLSKVQLKNLSEERPDLYIEDYFICNDSKRLDFLEDHINLSIEHPNYWLLKKFRQNTQSTIDIWCVLCLDPECLYFEDTLFSVGNAASSYSKRYGIGGSFDNFLALFQGKLQAGNAQSSRVFVRGSRKDCYPTDDQAEVLVKDRVPVSMIKEVYFETEEGLRSCKGAISLLGVNDLPPFVLNQNIFQKRSNL